MAISSVTFRNYRAFDGKGARIPWSEGFIAILGINNSGKSSALRAFFECRNIFERLANLGSSDLQLLFAERGAFYGQGVLTLADGERVESDRRPDVEPRISFEIDDAEVASIEVVVLSGRGGFRLEASLRDGRRSDARLAKDYGRANRPLEISIPLDDGSEFPWDWEKVRDDFHVMSQSMYVHAFRNALNFGGGFHYDLEVGTALLLRFQELKNGPDPAAGDRVVAMTNTLRDIFGFKSLEINVAIDGSHLVFVVDGIQRRQGELGAGLAQFVILAVNILLRQPRVLLLDEPELNLHAKLQLDFLTMMAGLTHGRVIFGTHSLGLARTAADVILVAERNADGDCRISDFQAISSLASTLGSLGYGGLNDPAFEGVLLVEGVTDVKAYQEILKHWGLGGRLVVVPLGGDDMARGGRDQELSELLRLSNRTFAIVDSERVAAGDPPTIARLEFSTSCSRLGIHHLVLERRSIENYLSQEKARVILHEPANPSFGPFERPKDVGAKWSKSDNWRVARAMTKSDFQRTDLSKFLTSVATALRKPS